MTRTGLRLGIDVARTKVDVAVLDEEGRVLAATKRVGDLGTVPKSADGIREVLAASGVQASEVSYVMLATSAVTDALDDRLDLLRVGLIRLGAPATRAVPPFQGWGAPLRGAVFGAATTLSGGREYDGRRLGALDREGARRFLEERRTAIDALAVVGVFAPAFPEEELEIREIARRVDPGLVVALSHELGSFGFLERENATLLNAAVARAAEAEIAAFTRLMEKLGLGEAELYLSQSDGTLMNVAYALAHPIRTVFASSAAALRGAAWLSGVEEAVVVDVGGGRTDIGMVRGGYPREALQGARVAGIPTNFPVPDLWTVPLGGQSVIRGRGQRTSLGPKVLRVPLEKGSRIFGGATLTLTDAAVSAGVLDLGSLPSSFPRRQAERAYALYLGAVEEGVDRMKASATPTSVLLVGGGGRILGGPIQGAREVICPDHGAVASAVGAATQEVSGRSDRIRRDGGGAGEVLGGAVSAAFADAIRAGADPTTVEVREVEEIPLDYLGSQATRLRVRVSGRIRGRAG